MILADVAAAKQAKEERKLDPTCELHDELFQDEDSWLDETLEGSLFAEGTSARHLNDRDHIFRLT